jgi:hypothetical protein
MSEGSQSNLPSIVWVIPAAALLIALAPLPYGYYTLLRIVVCGSAALIAYKQFQKERVVSLWVVLMSGVAILFNPFLPIYLDREIWAPIDVITAAIFLIHWRKSGKN